jgi:hypothetical protein
MSQVKNALVKFDTSCVTIGSERRSLRGSSGCTEHHYISYYCRGGGNRKHTALKFPRQYPLVLLVKVGWKLGKVLDCEEGNVMGSGLL